MDYKPKAVDLISAKLKASSTAEHIRKHPVIDDNCPQHVEPYAKACVFFAFGGVMCSDASDNAIMYLQLCENLNNVCNYSCASTVLPCLYRQLCNISLKIKENISGPVQLLHV